MAQITYADKVALNENPNVADINKVKATDMNEIKSVVNENGTTLSNLIANQYIESESNAYSCDYINDNIVNKVNNSYILNEDLRVTDSTYYNLDMNTIAKNAIYSTDEIEVGRWINGKPIYKKTYTGTTPTLSSGSWTTLFSISSLSIDELIDIEGMCGTGKFPRYSNSGYFIDIQAPTVSSNMQVMGAGYSNQPYKVTLYYTKTTD